MKRIPLIGEYLYYFRIFKEKVGKRFYVFLFLSLLVATMDGLGITMLLPLLKATGMESASHGASAYLESIFHLLGIPLELIGVLLMIGAIFLIKGGVKYGEQLFKAKLQARMLARLKKHFLNAFYRADYQYFASNNTGHFVNITNPQVNQFLKTFNAFGAFSAQFIMALVYLALAFFLNWAFTLMAVALGGFILFFLRFVSRLARNISLAQSQENSRLNKFLVQTLHAMHFLMATGRFERVKKSLYQSIDRLARLRVRLGIANALTQAIREPLTVLSLIGIILVQVYYFQAPVAPIIVTLLLFYRAMNTMIMFQSTWQNVMSTSGGVHYVLEEEARLREHQEISGKGNIDGFQEAVRFDKVSFWYEKGEAVVRDLDFSIRKNETVALVGESGAGKSTVSDLLTLLLKPKRGDIKIDGRSYKRLDLESWRKRIGFVPQDTVVFDDTVANNIALWTCDSEHPDCMQRIQSAAKRAYCEEFISELNKGYNTIIGDKGVRLSGGQRQRLAIARELFREPEFLILDEATSALDTASERYVQQSIDDLKGKLTVVIIAHRLSTIKNVDRIYVLDKGELVESGSYQDLVGDSSTLFYRMTELQSL